MDKDKITDFNFLFGVSDLDGINEMVKEFGEIIQSNMKDFAGGFNFLSDNELNSCMPVELWETKDNYYISIYIPFMEIEYVDISVKEGRILSVKANKTQFEPGTDCKLIFSEVPQELTREILLPGDVLAESMQKTDFGNYIAVVLSKKPEEPFIVDDTVNE